MGFLNEMEGSLNEMEYSLNEMEHSLPVEHMLRELSLFLLLHL